MGKKGEVKRTTLRDVVEQIIFRSATEGQWIVINGVDPCFFETEQAAREYAKSADSVFHAERGADGRRLGLKRMDRQERAVSG